MNANEIPADAVFMANARGEVFFKHGGWLRFLFYTTNFDLGDSRPATDEEAAAFIAAWAKREADTLAREAADNAVLAPLGLTTDDFYRFRSVSVDEKGRIVVDTRGGGGNRDCYCDKYFKPEESTDTSLGEGHSPDCVVVKQAKLRKHPAYLYDRDDEGDCTYAWFYFRNPERRQ